ncbi:MAG: hypothetical protein QOC81_228 [Thermoanaerobaculia bacterium]|nr:hypothetical protein [Thermoanaerobaculia bacterium]
MKEFDPASFEEQLQRINELALWDFEIAGFENGTLLILGSNDFVCYHYLEVELLGVTFSDLPHQFSHAQFRLGKDSDTQATVWVTAESWAAVGLKEYEIRASAIEVRIGKVYYYDRENLLPGERIASPRK